MRGNSHSGFMRIRENRDSLDSEVLRAPVFCSKRSHRTLHMRDFCSSSCEQPANKIIDVVQSEWVDPSDQTPLVWYEAYNQNEGGIADKLTNQPSVSKMVTAEPRLEIQLRLSTDIERFLNIRIERMTTSFRDQKAHVQKTSIIWIFLLHLHVRACMLKNSWSE
jgi:hypothetical protein